MISVFNRLAIFIFLIFFLLLFIQYPTSNSLPGNSTTWLALTISNTYSNLFSQFINGDHITTFLYPIKNVFAFGQGAPFLAFWFLFFKGILRDDIWSYYLFISSLFAISGWGIYYLARNLGADFFSSLIGGLFFSCSNFTLANIDDPHEIFFLFPALLITYLFKFKKSGTNKYFYLAMIYGGLEIYCSIYIFFFQTFFLLPFLLVLMKERFRPQRVIFTGLAFFSIISIPIFAFHLYNYLTIEIVNPFDPMAVVTDCSLKFNDFIAPLKGNLLYGGRLQDIHNPIFWSFIRRHAFLGGILWVLGFLGLIKYKKKYPALFWMALIGLIFSLGPIWNFGKNIEYPSPLFWFYEKIPLFIFFRVPLRAFFFTSLSLSIFAALFLSRQKQKFKAKGINLILGIILLIHFLENCPIPLQKFPVNNFMKPSSSLSDYFKNKKNQVLLDLPAKLGIEFERSQDILFPYNRELIYMYWQTQHKQNIIGGVHAYWPKSRIDLQRIIDLLPEKNALIKLKSVGLTQIVLHKDMILENELKIFNEIKFSPILKLAFEDENLAIFEWVSF